MRMTYSTIFKNDLSENSCAFETNGYKFESALILIHSITLNILLLIIVGVISVLVLIQN